MISWFPGRGWDGSEFGPPVEAEWAVLGHVSHTFTHFHLVLEVLGAKAEGEPERGSFLGPNAFRRDDLTTLMRKAHDLAFPPLP